MACPRRRESDGKPLVPCELRAHVHDARCVALTGTMLHESKRLVMTRQPKHNWIARLLLTPGRYTVRLHVDQTRVNLPGQSVIAGFCDVTFDVPELRGGVRHTCELRLWLHEPVAADSNGCDQHD